MLVSLNHLIIKIYAPQNFYTSYTHCTLLHINCTAQPTLVHYLHFQRSLIPTSASHSLPAPTIQQCFIMHFNVYTPQTDRETNVVACVHMHANSPTSKVSRAVLYTGLLTMVIFPIFLCYRMCKNNKYYSLKKD